MTRFKSTFFYIASISLVVSCSSTYYKRSETIAEKMNRYETRGLDNNKVPKHDLFPNFKKTRAGRGLASKTSSPKLNFSNKRLYFLSLFSQYESLRNYLPEVKTNDINICPSFHTSVVDFKKSFRPHAENQSIFTNRNYLSNLQNTNIKAIYPELSLPLSERNLYPTAFDLILNKVSNKDEVKKIVSKAFHMNMTKIRKELVELCDTGFSSNYYIYENLLTHIQSHGSLDHSTNGIKTLFKTSLFSNMALLNSLQTQSRSLRMLASGGMNQSHNKYENEIIRRLDVKWTQSYFNKIGRL